MAGNLLSFIIRMSYLDKKVYLCCIFKMKGIMNRRYRTGFLFSSPSFLVGAGSVLNIGGNYFEFNYSSHSEDSDWKAILADWSIIGEDIQEAEKQLIKSLND
jgi:hypothetical protein